ncbi:MAG: MFS transporter [Solirubrobacteraceae bacterium]
MPRAATSVGRTGGVLVMAVLTVSVQATLGAPLIPTIAREHHVSLEVAQWMLTLPLLTGVVATPVLGRLGDGAQRGRVLVAMLIAVLAGSVVAATAGSFTQLLIGRGLQGIGYAAVPLCVALARELLPGDHQARVIGWLSITAATGAGLGFPVTGLIAQDFGSSTAFWAGGAFTGLALWAALGLPRSAPGAARPRLDVPGAIALGAGSGAFVLGVSKAGTWGWGSTGTIALLAGGLAVLVLWGWIELRVDEPLVDLRLARHRAVFAANAGAVLIGASMFAAIALINRLAQAPEDTGYGFGASLVVSGLLLVPVSAGTLLSQPVARRAQRDLGSRRSLTAGGLVVCVALGALSVAHGAIWELAVTSALLGLGLGFTFALMPALVVASVPADRTGSAMSLNQVLRNAGGAFGSAIAITVLTGFTVAGGALPSEDGYAWAFRVGAAFSLGAALIFALALPRHEPN